ncbi:MAG: hypothetical protein WCA12_05070 [Burkholderiales bacterium]
MGPQNQAGHQRVDLEEIGKLVEAIERDLAKAREGSGDVDTLRAEVEALRDALAAEMPHHGDVRDRLHGLRASLEGAADELYDDAVKVSQYVTSIGKMLGL